MHLDCTITMGWPGLSNSPKNCVTVAQPSVNHMPGSSFKTFTAVALDFKLEMVRKRYKINETKTKQQQQYKTTTTEAKEKSFRKRINRSQRLTVLRMSLICSLRFLLVSAYCFSSSRKA